MNKLSFEEASSIRLEYLSGDFTFQQLATKYNVTKQFIYLVIHNKVYKDLNYVPPTVIKKKNEAEVTQELANSIRIDYQFGLISIYELHKKYLVSIDKVTKIVKNELLPSAEYNVGKDLRFISQETKTSIKSLAKDKKSISYIAKLLKVAPETVRRTLSEC